MQPVADAGAEFQPFERLLLVGVGLIGGSIGLAARRSGLARSVAGYSRRASTTAEALQSGLVDVVETDLHVALQHADAVCLAVPVAQFPALFEAIDAAGNHGLTVFDAGSTKGGVCEAARAVASRGVGGASPWFFQFVPSHPIAGAERHGPSAARADLYAGRTVISCPHELTSAPALQRVEAFWRALGMRVQRMTPDEHDRVFAAVSHLPHWIAYAYVHALLGTPTGVQDMQEGGGGFRDFSRIAASSPEMWLDIFSDNRAHMLQQLTLFEQSLSQMRAALEKGDHAALASMLHPVAAFRSGWTGR